MAPTPEKDRARQREYTRRWQRANPEKVAARSKRFREQNPEYHREWSQKNREKLAAARRAYREANPEKYLAAARRYREKNRDKIAERQHAARAGKPSLHLWNRHRMRPEDWAAMWDAQGGCCYLCSEPMDAGKTHIDHDHSCCGDHRSCQRCRRGLTHQACNQVIGQVGEDPGLLERIARNLRLKLAEAEQRMAGKPSQLDPGA